MQNVHRSFFSLGHLRFFGIFPWILDDPWQSLVRALNLGETIVSFVCIRSLMSTAVKVLLPSVTDQNSGACSREEINQKNRLIKIKLMWLLLRLAMFHSGFCIFICSIMRKHFAVFLNSWLICFFFYYYSLQELKWVRCSPREQIHGCLSCQECQSTPDESRENNGFSYY